MALMLKSNLLVSKKNDRNILFNDILNTFMGYSFQSATRILYICIRPDRIVHATAFVIPVVEHWLEREIAQ